MDLFNEFDKINIPMYVCSKEWIVIYRNRACKKYTNSPRVKGNFRKCFLDKENSIFPSENESAILIGCFIRDTYKTALCFEYRGYTVVMFPSLFDYDILFKESSVEENKQMTSLMRQLLDMISEKSLKDNDKYGVLEKMRNYIFSTIENYVALSMFDTDKRVIGNILQIYRFLCDNIIKLVNKNGYRVAYDISLIKDFGESIYVDTLYFSLVTAGTVLFCLSLSDDRRCSVEPNYIGGKIRNTFRFAYKLPLCFKKTENGMKDFMPYNPLEYLSFAPLEDMCGALGWNMNYSIDPEEKLNVSVSFEVEVDNRTVFRSAGKGQEYSPEDIILYVLAHTFGIMK